MMAIGHNARGHSAQLAIVFQVIVIATLILKKTIHVHAGFFFFFGSVNMRSPAGTHCAKGRHVCPEERTATSSGSS